MVTVPESALWSIIVLVAISLLGLGVSVINNRASLAALSRDKQDRTECLTTHAGLAVEVMAMSKDIEALTRQAGLKPSESPARNGSKRLPPDPREQEE